MQNFFKGMWGRRTPFIENLLGRGLQGKLKNKIDLKKCFEVGYDTVSNATRTLITALNDERTLTGLPLEKRLDSLDQLNTEIENMMLRTIKHHFPEHE